MRGSQLDWHILLSFYMVLISYHMVSVSGEYYVSDVYIPTYLHYNFTDETEGVLLDDVRINVSFTKVAGMVMYNMDSNMNQIIVTVYDGIPYVLHVEYNKLEINQELSKLCGCEWCRYEILVLRIQINEYITIRCNKGEPFRVMKGNNRGLNDNYPILYTAKDPKSKSKREAQLYLVNMPQSENILPNPDQMSGCIFHVLQSNRPLTLVDTTSNIVKTCTKTCINDICNGGQCLETYNKIPVCNCTATYSNGRYCNDSISSRNIRMKGYKLLFDSFKLSWQSSVEEILEMENKCVRLGIRKVGQRLIFHFSTAARRISTEVILQCYYVPNTPYILIVYFHNRHIDIWLHHNMTWTTVMAPVNINMKREVFTSVLLRSGDGSIDMVYKDYQEYTWRQISFLDSEGVFLTDLLPQTSTVVENAYTSMDGTITEATGTKENTNVPIIIYSVLAGIVFSVSSVCIWLVVSRCRRGYVLIHSRLSTVTI